MQHLQRQLARALPLERPQYLPERDSSNAVFHTLLIITHTMLRSFETVEKAVVAHQLHQRPATDVCRLWTVEHDPRDGSFLKMLDRYAVPFEPRAVAFALHSVATKRERVGQVSEVETASGVRRFLL